MVERSFFRLEPTARHAAAVLVFVAGWLTGCGGTVGILLGDSVTLPASPTSLTGGWVFTLTSTSGGAPFSNLVGSLDERTATSAGSNPLQALLEIQGAGSCYLGTVLLPLQGTVQASGASLYSFELNGQYLTLNAAADSTNTHLTGTYQVGGGCANNAQGTITGTRYLPLNGSYVGTTSGGRLTTTETLLLAENTQANGDGSFALTGTAQFQGLSCFTSGSITSGTSLGNVVHLVIGTNETGGSQVTLDGTLNPAATAINITSTAVTGGSCSGSLGSANLLLKS